jgi:hypothetical protein
MALLMPCWGCGKEFMTSACHGSSYCDDCNGNTAARAKEKDRWNAELIAIVPSELERHEYNPDFFHIPL